MVGLGHILNQPVRMWSQGGTLFPYPEVLLLVSHHILDGCSSLDHLLPMVGLGHILNQPVLAPPVGLQVPCDHYPTGFLLDPFGTMSSSTLGSIVWYIPHPCLQTFGIALQQHMLQLPHFYYATTLGSIV